MQIKPLESPLMVYHALNYARRGFPVFPVYEPFGSVCTCGNPDCGSPGKHPRTEHGVLDATRDPKQIRKWWSKWPDANIGVSADGLAIIDIDRGSGGFESFGELTKKFVNLTPTLTADTGGGGRHFIFQRDGNKIKNRTGIRPGIDLKTDGGYFVAPPSLHISGSRYRWAPDSGRHPAFLPKPWADFFSGESAKGTRDKATESGEKIPSGKRNAYLTSFAGTMRRRGASEQAITAALQVENRERCNPPLKEYEVKKIAESISRYEPTEKTPVVDTVSVDDFYAYMPMHTYIHVPTREIWPASSVNARIQVTNEKGDPIKANIVLDQTRPVEQMTWAPGEQMVIKDRIISEGGWISHSGCSCFNLYRPPVDLPGDPGQAGPWLEHVLKVYDGDKNHIISWLAHRVQKPQDKINHALVLGGLQGIGKDTLLEPVKSGVGPWNFYEVSPSHLFGRFNGYLKSVILRINEARDLGDVDRFKFYDHLKAYTAAPPDVLRCDEKHLREYSIPNVCGVIITTNHKTDGIYLPADDRRHYVAWSDLSRDDFPPDYWNSLYKWYATGGTGHVVAYLREYDLSRFDPKAPPPKTDAFWAIVDANRAPEDSELSDVLDDLGNPAATMLSRIIAVSGTDFAEWLKDRRNSRKIPHRLESVGYLPVRNNYAKDGLWKLDGKRQVIYARKELTERERITSALELTR